MILLAFFYFILVAAVQAAGLGEPSSWPLPLSWVAGSATAGLSPVLAEAGDDWGLYGKIAGGIVVAAALVGAWKVLTGREEPKKVQLQPAEIEVKSRVRWATYEELQILQRSLEDLRRESTSQNADIRDSIDQKFQHLMKEKSATAARTYDKIEVTSAGLRNELDAKVNEVRKEIHEMPGKIVTLLRDAMAFGHHKP